MSNNNPEDMDRLSNLPEALLLQIISLLPIKFAARTSLVARRFRHLWTASSSLELDSSDFSHDRLFIDATSLCLRLRDPSAPLLNFSLRTKYGTSPVPTISVLTEWLNRANLLGMRHLSLYMHIDTIETLSPLIIGFHSLQTLVIHAINYDSRHGYEFQSLIPPSYSQTQLKHLHIKAKLPPSDLRLFITGLRNLEYLSVVPFPYRDVDLSSSSVKILKLNSKFPLPKISLSFPSLEFLDLSIWLGMRQNHFYGALPLLRSAVVTIYNGSRKKVAQLVFRDEIHRKVVDESCSRMNNNI